MFVPSPSANGQNDKLSNSPYANADTPPYTTSIQISARPCTFVGSNPAPRPTSAQPNIWYGIHGPTPAVMIADANSVVHPSTNPNAGPSARAASTSKKNINSTPAVPADNGRSAAPSADST